MDMMTSEREDPSFLRVPSALSWQRMGDDYSDWCSSMESETDDDPELRATSAVQSAIGLSEYSSQPDISMICKQCDYYIDLRALREHRNYHRALDIMKYQGSAKPKNVQQLLSRRKSLLRELRKKTTSDEPLDSCEVQKLNDAYEILKSDLEDSFEAYRQLREETQTKVSGISLNCSAECAYAVGICSDGNHRWKSSMEDNRVFHNNFGNDRHKCFFGIYDGYHGHHASETVASELHNALLNEMSKFDPKTTCTCVPPNLPDMNEPLEEEISSRSSSKCTERTAMYVESAVMIQKIIEEAEKKLIEYDEKNDSLIKKTEKKRERIREKKQSDPFGNKMAGAFRKAHYYCDVLLSLGKDESSRVRWSGCSTLACVVHDHPQYKVEEDKENRCDEVFTKISPGVKENFNENGEREPTSGLNVEENSAVAPPKKLGMLYLSNTGNSHAVLVRGNKSYRLSRDHTPYNSKEKSRVLKEGGTLSESEKQLQVNGVLSTTRGLGNHGDPSLKKCVIPEPYTTSVPIDQYAQFIILASNGVWEVFTEQDVASFLTQMLPNNQVPGASTINSSVYALWNSISSQLSSAVPLSNASNGTQNGADMQQASFNPVAKSTVSRQEARPETRDSKVSKTSITFAGDVENEESNYSIKDGSSYSKSNGNGSQGNAENGNKIRRESQGRPPKKYLSQQDDLQTEAGSQMGDKEYDDCTNSGTEGDNDTYLDDFSINSDFPINGSAVPSRAEMQRVFAKAMAERLAQAAVLAGSKDNITVMVVLLPGCGL